MHCRRKPLKRDTQREIRLLLIVSNTCKMILNCLRDIIMITNMSVFVIICHAEHEVIFEIDMCDWNDIGYSLADEFLLIRQHHACRPHLSS